jgi:hypothetical protein
VVAYELFASLTVDFGAAWYCSENMGCDFTLDRFRFNKLSTSRPLPFLFDIIFLSFLKGTKLKSKGGNSGNQKIE